MYMVYDGPGFSTTCWGCLNTPPPPSISAPAHRRTKRKTAFESSRKIISKSFRSFFGSGQNWGHQGSKFQIFPNGFWTIKSLILKVEQRVWYHRVFLVKARRTMYNLTLKGQDQNLTSGQGHSETQVGQIIHHSMRLAETNAMTAIPRLYLIWFSSYWQKTVGYLEWPPWPLEGSPTKNFTWSSINTLPYVIPFI